MKPALLSPLCMDLKVVEAAVHVTEIRRSVHGPSVRTKYNCKLPGGQRHGRLPIRACIVDTELLVKTHQFVDMAFDGVRRPA